MKYSIDFLLKAHNHCHSHKVEVLASEMCVCFYCQNTFSPNEIKEWFEESDGRVTAVCPKCNIDSVLGSKSGLPLTDKEFIDEMTEYFFS
ncbi:cytoplasmic protein [Pontibacter kalidii]|uniref:cytoplasmic protein n=1 Tax=Pontibacter kalidii TaxID=2592049 RepID=UPI00225AD068|nr:cytoplasmic protein [Pontibacter kalidii]